mmetsp:Transcript_35628/g.26467  ORF Transcript_35628/g.26467 Transcript_35628/m.26467 type:complete len:85 (+) Transcript_35628:249-503(+)
MRMKALEKELALLRETALVQQRSHEREVCSSAPGSIAHSDKAYTSGKKSVSDIFGQIRYSGGAGQNSLCGLEEAEEEEERNCDF